MDNQLNATGGSGSQSTTQDPQAAQGDNNGSITSGSLQSGTAQTLLNSQAGLQLNPTALPGVNLNNTLTTTQTPVTHTTPRHINAPLFGFSIILFLVAVAMFWFTSRSAKTTTKN